MSVNHTAAIAARFSASAETYDRSACVQKAVSERVSEMVARLPEPRQVLEVGCGTGLLTERLLDVLPKAGIHALDVSEGMIKQARSRLKNAGRVTWIDTRTLKAEP
jgi:malonyl-CoA O-methyltransferase